MEKPALARGWPETPPSPFLAAVASVFLAVCLCFFPPCLIFSRLQSPSPPPLQQLPFLGRTPSLHCLSVCTSWGAPVNSASYPEKALPMTPSTSLCHVSLLRFSRKRERHTSSLPPQRWQTVSQSSHPCFQYGRRGPGGHGCCLCGRESGTRTLRAKQGPSTRETRGSEVASGGTGPCRTGSCPRSRPEALQTCPSEEGSWRRWS